MNINKVLPAHLRADFDHDCEPLAVTTIAQFHALVLAKRDRKLYYAGRAHEMHIKEPTL